MRTALFPLITATWMVACGPTYPVDDRVTQPPPQGDTVRLPDADRPVDRGISVDADLSDEIDARVLRYLKTTRVAGAALAVVKDGEVLHTAGYGWADVDDEAALTAQTPVLLASISKTFVGITAMQLLEEGSLQLEERVDAFTGFAVDHPTSDAPITLRHALTHEASLLDTSMFYGQFVAGDATVSMRDYVEGYVTPGGDFWRDDNFFEYAPGEEAFYSNVSAGLAAVAVEHVAGMDFREVVRTRIQDVADMPNTGFLLADLPQPPSLGYSVDGRDHITWEPFGYPNMADGLMRSSADDMGRYLAAFQRGDFLDPDAIDQMLAPQTIDPPQDDAQGLMWSTRERRSRTLAGHSGFHWGAVTEMWFDRETGAGYVLALNTNVRDLEFPKRMALETDLLAFAESR
ncbi:MAG: beta-lactamase family protein [Myxococcales bacterium]|nr:beta-lactamase family protein [Myxococcales bacterium]